MFGFITREWVGSEIPSAMASPTIVFNRVTSTLYIYPSYAWTDASKNSPYTIGFTTSTAPYDAIPFINEYGGALNSIARNKQVNIHATLSSEANLTLKFEVKDWDTEEITVPPFN